MEQQRGLQVSSVGENPLPEGKERECKSVTDPENTVSFHHSEINMVKLNILGINKSFEGHSTEQIVWACMTLGWFLNLLTGYLAKKCISLTPCATLKASMCFRDLSLPKSLYLYVNYRCTALG